MVRNLKMQNEVGVDTKTITKNLEEMGMKNYVWEELRQIQKADVLLDSWTSKDDTEIGRLVRLRAYWIDMINVRILIEGIENNLPVGVSRFGEN